MDLLCEKGIEFFSSDIDINMTSDFNTIKVIDNTDTQTHTLKKDKTSVAYFTFARALTALSYDHYHNYYVKMAECSPWSSISAHPRVNVKPTDLSTCGRHIE